MDLVIDVYGLTRAFPKDEQFALIVQLKKSAVSIPSNIAEGSRRMSKTDFRRFLLIAFGSGAELETQLEISLRLSFMKAEEYEVTIDKLNEIMKMLNVFITSLESKWVNNYLLLSTHY